VDTPRPSPRTNWTRRVAHQVCAGIRELLLRNEDAQRAAQGGRDRRARTIPATTALARSAVADEK
jgi:hypothetical protein